MGAMPVQAEEGPEIKVMGWQGSINQPLPAYYTLELKDSHLHLLILKGLVYSLSCH